MASLAQDHSLSWFDYWLGDYAGHRGSHEDILALLKTFDQVLEGLLEQWELDLDLILLTSDHGNLEDSSVRGHTSNPVPILLMGPQSLREKFPDGPMDLTSIYFGILRTLFKPKK